MPGKPQLTADPVSEESKGDTKSHLQPKTLTHYSAHTSFSQQSMN